MARPRKLTHEAAADRADFTYWVNRSRGFSVESRAGRIGRVESVGHARATATPTSIVVRAARKGEGVRVVAVSEVASVSPREKTLTLYD